MAEPNDEPRASARGSSSSRRESVSDMPLHTLYAQLVAERIPESGQMFNYVVGIAGMVQSAATNDATGAVNNFLATTTWNGLQFSDELCYRQLQSNIRAYLSQPERDPQYDARLSSAAVGEGMQQLNLGSGTYNQPGQSASLNSVKSEGSNSTVTDQALTLHTVHNTLAQALSGGTDHDPDHTHDYAPEYAPDHALYHEYGQQMSEISNQSMKSATSSMNGGRRRAWSYGMVDMLRAKNNSLVVQHVWEFSETMTRTLSLDSAVTGGSPRLEPELPNLAEMYDQYGSSRQLEEFENVESASGAGMKRVNYSCATDNGRFIVHKKLGTGAFAQIWEATDRSTRQTVAIKDIGLTPAFATDLENEYAIISKINHPNVIKVFHKYACLPCRARGVIRFCRLSSMSWWLGLCMWSCVQ